MTQKFVAEDYFENLLNNDTRVRIKSAEYFSWLARKEYNTYSKNIFENINTYDKLLPLLNDDEPKVVCGIIQALGCSYERYRKDKRIEKELLKLFNSKNNDIIYNVCVWSSDIENNAKYNHIINLLEKTKSQKLLSVLCRYFNFNTENNMKNRVQDILLNKLETVKNEYSMKIIIGTLVRIRNEENMDKLRKYIEKQPNACKEMIKYQIKINVRAIEKDKVENDLNIK